MAGSGRSREERYARLASRLDPNASRGEMEAAIAEEFGDDPGYSQAYKESVKLDGEWYDLVGAYGSPEAKWHGLMLKEEPSGSSNGSYTMASLAQPMATMQQPSMAGVGPRGSAPMPVADAAYAPLTGAPMSELASTDAVIQELLARAVSRPRDRAFLPSRKDPAFLPGRRDPAFLE